MAKFFARMFFCAAPALGLGVIVALTDWRAGLIVGICAFGAGIEITSEPPKDGWRR